MRDIIPAPCLRTPRVIVLAALLAVACALGGEDGRQLIMTTAEHIATADEMAGIVTEGSGRIDILSVDVPGAGWP